MTPTASTTTPTVPLVYLIAAERAWRLIVEAARRVRPLCDALGHAELGDHLFKAVGDAARAGTHLLEECYNSTEELGSMPKLDQEIPNAIFRLRAIAALADQGYGPTDRLRHPTARDLWYAIDFFVYQLEDQFEGDWATADPAVALKWAAPLVR